MIKIFLPLIFLLCSRAAFCQDSLSVKDQIFEKVEKEADYPGGVETWAPLPKLLAVTIL